LSASSGASAFCPSADPAAQIALMHRELVEDRGWLTEKQYLQALSFCMLLPGPEAMQLATYAGWRWPASRAV
jgi:chromate transporter